MKKLLSIALLAAFSFYTKAQVLTVPLVAQEHTQWCWAGCSKCILDYYGDTLEQCVIAEYARANITWTSFGTVNCCVNANAGCNNPNYEATYPGSIQDILLHFSSIGSTELSHALSSPDITSLLAANNLFVEHWTWYAGGGHFVVGYGISGTDVYYMNPWPGEGKHIATHASMVDDGQHMWDYTLTIDHTTVSTPQLQTLAAADVFPNPSTSTVTFRNTTGSPATFYVYNTLGQKVLSVNVDGTTTNDLSHLPRGIYLVKITTQKGQKQTKLILE